jgi:predicted transcriptional regulator
LIAGGPECSCRRVGNSKKLTIDRIALSLTVTYISCRTYGGANAMNNSDQASDLLALTTEIVAAHVSNNTVSVGDLPQLINQVYHSLANIGTAPVAPAERPQPAVPVKKSVHADFIICLEDGKKLKMLKRHLKTAYNMTPETYRERWGLGADYPMVAPNYARQRSRLAKEIGLGTRARRPRV